MEWLVGEELGEDARLVVEVVAHVGQVERLVDVEAVVQLELRLDRPDLLAVRLVETLSLVLLDQVDAVGNGRILEPSLGWRARCQIRRLSS